MEDEHSIIEATPFQRSQGDESQHGFRIKPVPTAIGIVFAILAIAAGFMFTARAVRVTISPLPDSFRFTSGFSYQLGERYLMLPGSYDLTAAKSGYHVLSTSIDVNDDADQDFSLELEKLPGILVVTTSPDAVVNVIIDQQPRGPSPLTLDEIPAGLHDVSIRSERYLDYDTEILITGMRQPQSIEIPISPAWANISISSHPEDASILVDDEALATTPGIVEALQGERTIQIRKKGYKTWQTTVDIVAGVDQTIDKVVLEKSDGKVSILSTPEGANVRLNGRYRGQTPLELTIAPGVSYQVTLSKAGYEPLQRKILVQPEEALSLSNTLLPVLGVVRLMVDPDGAELYIDDKPMGNPSQRFSLTASQHQIRIVKEGYAEYTTKVTPQPGSTQQLVIQLQTEEEARIASIPTSFENGVGQTLQLIIPAEFTMGASRREPGRRSNEVQKTVQLTRAYYMSVNEVSNLQFKKFDPTHDSGVLGRALLSDDDRPVVNLSWRLAVEFCNWLSQRDSLPLAYEEVHGLWQAVKPLNTGYRLPTEAEWVWAARYANGPDPTRFPWGNNMPPTDIDANYADESAANMVPYTISGYHDAYRGPSPIGNYPANELGIHDLAGNVSEWMHDYYSVETPREKQIDPVGPEKGDYHVIRGSSYKHGRFSELRWTYRDYGTEPRADVGFRIARFLE